MRWVYRLALTFAVIAPLHAPAFAAEPEAPAVLIGATEAIRIAIQNRLSAKFTAASNARKSEQGALVEFYSAPEHHLLWVDDKELTDRGKMVMAEIAKADDYGLRASDYALPKPDTFDASDPKATDWLADAEIKISFAVLGYANDARGGRINPSRLSENLDPSLALPNPSEVIESIAFRSDPAAYLRSFQPDQPQFEALRQKLLELRGGNPKSADDKSAVIIPDGPMLKMGMQHEQVVLLRKRLDVPANSHAEENTFDAALVEVVERFQDAHGVLPDGMVGPGIRRLLNGRQKTSVAGGSAKIRAILVNMERWRWLPHDLGPYYVTVNIPEFTLRVVADSKTVHTTRVVVGKPDKQTPVFSDEMQEIVFNPFWNVPTSIKVEEIRPYLREEAAWFFGGGGWNAGCSSVTICASNISAVMSIPAPSTGTRWTSAISRSTSRPDLTTCSATSNSCFPTSTTSTCTPQKFLFAQPVRAESHGCMRVQNPEQLALILLRHDQGWNEARIASAISDGYDSHVALRQRITVYITYFTLKVNEDGSTSNYGDIYGHDARMAAALGL